MMFLIANQLVHTLKYGYAVKHSLRIFFTGSSGLKTFPEFEAVGEIDTIQAAYCNKSTIMATQDWAKKALNPSQEQFKFLEVCCFVSMPAFFKFEIDEIKAHFNQSAGTVCLLLVILHKPHCS